MQLDIVRQYVVYFEISFERETSLKGYETALIGLNDMPGEQAAGAYLFQLGNLVRVWKA